MDGRRPSITFADTWCCFRGRLSKQKSETLWLASLNGVLFYAYREMEMEYTSMAASVDRRISHQSSEDGSLPEGTTSVKCPICDITEMQADKGNVCVECERFVCHSCGSFEMSQNTKVNWQFPLNFCWTLCISQGQCYFPLFSCGFCFVLAWSWGNVLKAHLECRFVEVCHVMTTIELVCLSRVQIVEPFAWGCFCLVTAKMRFWFIYMIACCHEDSVCRKKPQAECAFIYVATG